MKSASHTAGRTLIWSRKIGRPDRAIDADVPSAAPMCPRVMSHTKRSLVFEGSSIRSRKRPRDARSPDPPAMGRAPDGDQGIKRTPAERATAQ